LALTPTLMLTLTLALMLVSLTKEEVVKKKAGM
jgi:hypothetical protein